ncbi:MAG TPA: peptide-N4-asparagine amidase [Thermoanaerobaculia bacterium]|nr:peptide-N4-asparagine amidase [Thermoanaerobaculia bacterium]
MSHVSRSPWLKSFLPVILVMASLCLALPGLAQPVVGSSNTATADPSVPRPHTTPCAVQLFSNFQFADFSPKPFTYTPAAGCPGPWAKVVLEADFSVTAGRQFDRTAQIAVGHVNVYFGTTPEPSRTVAPTWHVERDLTDYSPLFRTAQAGEANIGNLVNSTFTGVISGSARLLFYPSSHSEPAPRTADVVLPMATAPGGAVLLQTTADVLAPTFSLPANVESAYLDVITQSQSSDEFWYTCVPDDVANELFSCGGTAFREAEVTIDGQPAGLAPVYPWIFTGGIDPLLWRPIPGVQTLNFPPYRVDLTPFAGVLSNGQPHQVGLSVFNSNHYFQVTGTLLLYLDAGSSHVTGGVTQNTLGSGPHPSVEENLTTATDGTITGTVNTAAQRSFTLAGYVNTSHGKVETTIRQHVEFSNDQQFVNSATQFVQNITQTTQVHSETDTKQPGSVSHSETQLSYPLSLDINFVVNPDGSFAQTTTSDQAFASQEARGGNAGDDHNGASKVFNNVTSTDTLLFDAAGNLTGFQGRKSSQTYSSQSPGGVCYNRTITAENGVLTAVTDQNGCGGHGDR